MISRVLKITRRDQFWYPLVNSGIAGSVGNADWPNSGREREVGLYPEPIRIRMGPLLLNCLRWMPTTRRVFRFLVTTGTLFGVNQEACPIGVSGAK